MEVNKLWRENIITVALGQHKRGRDRGGGGERGDRLYNAAKHRFLALAVIIAASNPTVSSK